MKFACIYNERESHVGTDFASFRFFCKKSVTRTVVPPFRKKARSAQLFTCKRVHDVSLSLPPFCESAFGTVYIYKVHIVHKNRQVRSVLVDYEISSNVTFGVALCTSSKISSIDMQYSLKSLGSEKNPYIFTLKYPL